MFGWTGYRTAVLSELDPEPLTPLDKNVVGSLVGYSQHSSFYFYTTTGVHSEQRPCVPLLRYSLNSCQGENEDADQDIAHVIDPELWAEHYLQCCTLLLGSHVETTMDRIGDV